MILRAGDVVEIRRFSNITIIEVDCVEHFVSNADNILNNSNHMTGYEHKIMYDIEVEV